MYITESKLRNIIRNELILTESLNSSQRALQTSLLVLIPLLMSGITPKGESEQVGDQYRQLMTAAIMKQIKERKLNPENPEHADQIRIIVLDQMREGPMHYFKKKGLLSTDDKEFDASSVMKR